MISINTKDLNIKLKSIKLNEMNYLKRCIAISCVNVQKGGRRGCPVDTGRLRSSIKFRIIKNGMEGQIYSDAFYWAYVEFGTGIYAYKGGGRSTPWRYFNEKYNTIVITRGQKPKLMMTNAWKQEKPQLIMRVRRYKGGK